VGPMIEARSRLNAVVARSPHTANQLSDRNKCSSRRVPRVDDWLKNILVCPRDHFSVQIESNGLVCHAGHRYPIVAGVPLMLLPEVKQTQRAAKISLEHASLRGHMGKVTDQSIAGVDEFGQHGIGATNGLAYRTLSG